MVHYLIMICFGSAVIKAIQLGLAVPGWGIPFPKEISYALMWVTGILGLLTVLNLAIQGMGAPFAIALSRRLSIQWMYAWTRNPMTLSFWAFLFSMGLWLHSLWFIAWVIFLVIPAFVFFLKMFEERELEIRFGQSYLEYKKNTPMFWSQIPKM